MAPTDASQLVILGRPDIADALLLSDEARWNQTEEDWSIFMAHGECYGVRKFGQLAASGAILPFGGFGWISMVLVTADWRRRGLASRLMIRCIDSMRARGCASLLDATPEGALVYRRLGFRSQCGMVRWRGNGLGMPRLRSLIPPPSRAQIWAQDARAFGGDRRFLLDNFLDRRGTVVLGNERSYIILREGRRATQIGPLVALDNAGAKGLLEEALKIAIGPVILDVLDAGASLDPVLKAHGFEPFRTFERMVLDRPDLPGHPASIMIAAGPEFG